MVQSGDGKRNMLLGCPKQFTVDSLFSDSQNNVSKIIKNLRGDICRFLTHLLLRKQFVETYGHCKL